MSIDKDLLDRLMEGRSPGDLFGKSGILSELTKALAERAFNTEMTLHLNEERADGGSAEDNLPPNRRNGRSQKTVTTESGKVVLDILRDRNGTFDPMLIAKYQRRFPEFARKAIATALKAIYTAVDATEAEAALGGFEESDLARQYPAIAPSWRRA